MYDDSLRKETVFTNPNQITGGHDLTYETGSATIKYSRADGLPDLTLKFDTQKMVDILGEVKDGEVLTLTGSLHDGFEIAGDDTITILDKGKEKK